MTTNKEKITWTSYTQTSTDVEGNKHTTEQWFSDEKCEFTIEKDTTAWPPRFVLKYTHVDENLGTFLVSVTNHSLSPLQAYAQKLYENREEVVLTEL